MNNEVAKTPNPYPIGRRIDWLDSSRGLAFLMIIYSHTVLHDSTVMKFFGPIFLSIFFFVSGYLSKEGLSFSKYAEQRTRTLFLPFLLWGLLLFVKRHIFSLTNKSSEWGHDLWLFILQDGRDNFLWFIPSLFVFSLIFYPFLKYCRSTSSLLASLAALCVCNYTYSYIFDGPELPYHLHTVGFACLLMGMGKLYRRHESLFNRYMSRPFAAIALVAYTLVCSFSDYMSYSGSPLMINWIAATLTGLYLMIYISQQKVAANRLMVKIGANTLICFILHGQIYSIIEKVAEMSGLLSKFQTSFAASQCFAAAETLLTAVLLLIPIWIVNRYLPWSIGKGFHLWKAE